MYPSKGHKRSSRGGFTLVELMVAAFISAFVMAGIMSSYLFLGRNLTRLNYFQQLDVMTRHVFTELTRDVGVASSISSSSTSTALYLTVSVATGKTLTIINTDGSPLTLSGGTSTTITYTYDATNKVFRRFVGTDTYNASSTTDRVSHTSILISTYRTSALDFTNPISFRYYNKGGGQTPLIATSAVVPLNAKGIELSLYLKLGSSGGGTQTSFTASSPRLLLRNTTANSLLPP